jgi:flagellar basal-body rod protein FlgG
VHERGIDNIIIRFNYSIFVRLIFYLAELMLLCGYWHRSGFPSTIIKRSAVLIKVGGLSIRFLLLVELSYRRLALPAEDKESELYIGTSFAYVIIKQEIIMQNGLYVATSGLLMQQMRVDNISNNLSNVNTNGFKKDLALFSDYRPVDKRFPQNWVQKTLYNKTINSSVKLDDIYTNHEQGHFVPTNNSLDLALEDPNNFFAVETPWGIRYTKNGEFTLNSDGEMVTRDGFNVLDANTNAPIQIPQNMGAISITKEGQVFAGDTNIAQVGVAHFNDLEYLQKVGHNLYTAVDILPQVPENPTVLQGFVESSNVNPIQEMVLMVDAMRGFEMYQKMIQTYDTLNEQASTAIARL